MPTIDEVITRAAEANPQSIAVREWGGRELSYLQLNAAVSSFAAWARARGVREGDVIAIHLPNSIAYLVTQFGSFRAGAVAAYVNYRLMPAEARRQFRMCNARLVVTTSAKAAELSCDREFVDTIFIVDGPADEGVHSVEEIMASNLLPDFTTNGLEDQDAIIRFTSGSTGDPKGLIVTHRAWLIRAISILTEEVPVKKGSTTLVLGQLSHQAGLFVIPTFLRGGTLLVMEKFSLETVAEIFSSVRVSCVQIVPTMFTLILNNARARAAFSASTLEHVVYGGSPIRQNVLEEAMRLLPQTEFVQSYGSHEAGSISFLGSVTHRDSAQRLSAGRPFLATQVRLANAGADGIGEVEVKSPWLPNARLTANGREAITEEWARTGDLAEIVDGLLFLRDRMNDVIISGGFNVYPAEVEKVVSEHPDVLDVAVTSAPDDKWGERVIAFIVSRTNRDLDEEALRQHCKTQLAGYKVPKEFRTIPEMPLNPNGKPDRRLLSKPLWAGHDRRIN